MLEKIKQIFQQSSTQKRRKAILKEALNNHACPTCRWAVGGSCKTSGGKIAQKQHVPAIELRQKIKFQVSNLSEQRLLDPRPIMIAGRIYNL